MDFSESPLDLAGTRIAHYLLESKLGQGGMGAVYLATDTVLRRSVAIKLLSRATSFRSRQRFLREARVSAALDHPNICQVYEVGEADGQPFLVMQYLAGETLKKEIDRGLSIDDSLCFSFQIVDALAHAHQKNVVHRDVKPGNIMITADKSVKVLDFGLARFERNTRDSHVATDSLMTRSGAILGTAPYMSPEQVDGGQVDSRSDIFSVGCVIYEMLAGERAFQGDSALAIWNAVLSQDPVLTPDSGVPQELAAVLARSLAKDRNQRYQTLGEFREDLVRASRQVNEKTLLLDEIDHTENKLSPGSDDSASSSVKPVVQSSKFQLAETTSGFFVALSAVLLIALGIAVGHLYRQNRAAQGMEQLQQVQQLAFAQDFVEAYELARRLRTYLPDDSLLSQLWPVVAMELSVASEPSNADVWLSRFDNQNSRAAAPPERIGRTPLVGFQAPRGDYHLIVEKAGYVRNERTISGSLFKYGKALIPGPHVFEFTEKLEKVAEIPPGMVRVEGGEYRLGGWGRPTQESVELDDFLIDRFEVSNKQYLEFIRAGGYRKREYWNTSSLQESSGSWASRLVNLVDSTGLPGPRGWSNQSFPFGQEDHPVTGISAIEAAAYAVFRGKELPTIFQWEKAARARQATYFAWAIMPWGPATNGFLGRANFASQATIPVNALPFGVSPYGCYNMAGNVAEWCRAGSNGYWLAGGSWQDLPYIFGKFAPVPETFSSRAIGFRCVQNADSATGDQGAQWSRASAGEFTFPALEERASKNWLSHYSYDRQPMAEATINSEEGPDWIRQLITAPLSENEEFMAYLYLPKGFEPPFEVIQFVPGSIAFGSGWPVTLAVESFMAPYIKAGRAVMAVVYRGFRERPFSPDFQIPSGGSVSYRQLFVSWVIDSRRGIDYLETRDDILSDSIAFLGISEGTRVGMVAMSVDPRYRAMVLLGSGLIPDEVGLLPEVDPKYFLHMMTTPKLVLGGRYDEIIPYSVAIKPMFDRLPEPKELVTYDGGHTPPFEVAVPAVNTWLDKTLTPNNK